MSTDQKVIASPIPVNTPLLDSGMMSLPWTKYLKNLGDIATRSSTPQNKSPVTGTSKYLGIVTAYPPSSVAGNTCTIGTDSYLYNGSSWSKTLTHVLNGSLCCISHDLGSASPAAFSLDLPFESALPFIYENTEYLAGTKEVTIPLGRRVVYLTYTIKN